MDGKTCPTCGAPIDPEAPRGLCSVCLPKQAVPPGRDTIREVLEAKLRGQYRVVRLLGKGGMGAVYLARDLTLDREVAIKVIPTESNAPEVHERFRREAKTVARLSHPNIVPLHAFGEVGGMPYFVMGYVRGESLAARLRRERKLSEQESRRVLTEIAGALDHAHRQGIVHRDIKPDNVLLDDESGRALLADFGIAKAVGAGDTLAGAGSVVGTPHYMSPEQAMGRDDVDGRTDVYSLGVMAYVMLGGHLPFEGSSAAEVLRKRLSQEAAPLRSVAPTVAEPLARVVDRCLARDPAARWPDARSVERALGATESGQLPDPLDAFQGNGIPGAVLAALLLLAIRLAEGPSFLLPLNAGLVALAYVFVLVRLKARGFSLGESQRVIWTEPAWWPFWYPRSLRRYGNVWSRLPAPVRYLRWWPPAAGAYALACLYDPSRHFVPKTIGLLALTAVWVILVARVKVTLRRRGLGPTDIHEMMWAAASRGTLWTRPHVTAVLAPAGRPEAGRRPASPHDHLRAILRDAEELSGPLRSLGPQAASAARQLLAAIDHADEEIAVLARTLELGEEQRLAERIAALGPAPAACGGEAAVPLRELLEKQLALVRGLSGRMEEARKRRSRRAEMLETLAFHVASLRARTIEGPNEMRALGERVRALCDDIGRQDTAPAGTTAGADDGIFEMSTVGRTRDEPGPG
jgi:predicted Ser/Thr protein kinase